MAAAFIMGVTDIFTIEDSDDYMLVGFGKGTVLKGNAVFLSNPYKDDEESEKVISVIKKIEIKNENAWEEVEEASDRIMAVRVEKREAFSYSRGSVICTMDAEQKEIRNMHATALGDIYIVGKKLELTQDEYDALSVTELSDIYRLNAWYQNTQAKEERVESREENRKLADKLGAELARRIVDLDHVYCIFSRVTGEPYLFHKFSKIDDKYFITPPCIRFITDIYFEEAQKNFPTDKFYFQKLEAGVDGMGIANFLKTAFYIEGARGLEVNTDLTYIKRENTTVIYKDYMISENEELTSFILLQRQLGTPKTEDEEMLSRLYHEHYTRNIYKANLVVPAKFQDDEGNDLPKGQIVIATFPAKEEGKYAVRAFTDPWHMMLAYPEKPKYITIKVQEAIEKYDLAINVVPFSKVYTYLDKQAYDIMKELMEKVEN